MLNLIFGILWIGLFFLSVGFRTWKAYEGKWKILEFIVIFLQLVIGIAYLYKGVTALVA